MRKLILIVCLCCVAFGLAAEQKVTALPRIKAVSAVPYGKFINSATQQDFIAVGNSYVNLVTINGAVHHCNFTPGLYDKEEAEKALSEMRRSGYNVVRIFIDKGHFARNRLGIYGLDGPFENKTPALYKPYMENLIDFLIRATKHQVYVIAAFEIWPYTRFYSDLALSGSPDIEGQHNRTILVENTIRAKEIFLEQFVTYIKGSNPDLLTTIFAYDVQNELYCRSDMKPFSLTTGKVTTANGKTYDMANAADRQACQDENTVYWANRCVAAIKKHDPDALVTASVFPFWPVKKQAGSGLISSGRGDQRWPARPAVLLESDFDLIDIHLYLGWQGTMDQILASSEWDRIDMSKKPFVVFEYGLHRDETRIPVNSVYDAAEYLFDFRQQMFAKGFSGVSLFTWHTLIHTRWTAVEQGGVINSFLRPCPWWKFEQAEDIAKFNFNSKGWKFEKNVRCDLTPSKPGGLSGFDSLDKEVFRGISQLEYSFDASGGALNLEPEWFRMNAFDSIAFKIEIINESPLDMLTLCWKSENDADWPDGNVQQFKITPNTGALKVYTVNLGQNPAWQGLVHKIKITADTAAVKSGSIKIRAMGFVNTVLPHGAGK